MKLIPGFFLFFGGGGYCFKENFFFFSRVEKAVIIYSAAIFNVDYFFLKKWNAFVVSHQKNLT